MYEDIAFWALCEANDGRTVVIPVESMDFDRQGEPRGVFVPKMPDSSHFVGIKSPEDDEENWELWTKRFHENGDPYKDPDKKE